MNPEQKKAYMTEYRAKNRAKINAQARLRLAEITLPPGEDERVRREYAWIFAGVRR